MEPATGPPGLLPRLKAMVGWKSAPPLLAVPRVIEVPHHAAANMRERFGHAGQRAADNKTRTTKYTIVSFIPKALLEQYRQGRGWLTIPLVGVLTAGQASHRTCNCASAGVWRTSTSPWWRRCRSRPTAPCGECGAGRIDSHAGAPLNPGGPPTSATPLPPGGPRVLGPAPAALRLGRASSAPPAARPG